MNRIESGKRVMQVTVSKDDYEKIRKAAYEMEVTVNKAIVLLAVKQLEK